MRAIAWVGVLLMIAGLAALAVGSFSYTTKEKVLDIGPVHATEDKEHNVAIPPAVGVAAILAGGALVFVGRRRA
ncbi:MAG TPA: DUF3185 domain-containing protein [Alphaproteobacteria bacterium]|nr:DUF3185 domain-containing protein [Alphaproteobacteria bacterium]